MGNIETFFPEALKVMKFPKTTICYSCKYVDDLIPKRNESLYFPHKNNIPSQPRFSTNTHSWCGKYWRGGKWNELNNWSLKREKL